MNTAMKLVILTTFFAIAIQVCKSRPTVDIPAEETSKTITPHINQQQQTLQDITGPNPIPDLSSKPQQQSHPIVLITKVTRLRQESTTKSNEMELIDELLRLPNVAAKTDYEHQKREVDRVIKELTEQVKVISPNTTIESESNSTDSKRPLIKGFIEASETIGEIDSDEHHQDEVIDEEEIEEDIIEGPESKREIQSDEESGIVEDVLDAMEGAEANIVFRPLFKYRQEIVQKRKVPNTFNL